MRQCRLFLLTRSLLKRIQVSNQIYSWRTDLLWKCLFALMREASTPQSCRQGAHNGCRHGVRSKDEANKGSKSMFNVPTRHVFSATFPYSTASSWNTRKIGFAGDFNLDVFAQIPGPPPRHTRSCKVPKGTKIGTYYRTRRDVLSPISRFSRSLTSPSSPFKDCL